jgi:hypothetical protein
MKLLIISILFSIGVNAQGFKLKEHIAPATFIFIAGAADGFRDALLFRTDKVIDKLNLNPNWWDYRISYVRKYRNHDPAQGQSLGNKLLTPVSDGIHITSLVNRLFTFGAISIKIGQKKKKFLIYVLEGVSYWIINRAAFTIVYNSF